jgi:hypothetical protein
VRQDLFFQLIPVQPKDSLFASAIVACGSSTKAESSLDTAFLCILTEYRNHQLHSGTSFAARRQHGGTVQSSGQVTNSESAPQLGFGPARPIQQRRPTCCKSGYCRIGTEFPEEDKRGKPRLIAAPGGEDGAHNSSGYKTVCLLASTGRGSKPPAREGCYALAAGS